MSKMIHPKRWQLLLLSLVLLVSILPIPILPIPQFGSGVAEADVGWLGTWKYRIPIDIDYTNKIGSSITGMPVLITPPSDVYDEIGASYTKIAVTTADGTSQLYVNMDEWWAGDGGIYKLWAGNSTWTISEDTTIYLYFDSAQAANTAYVGDKDSAVATNVWAHARYRAVYHMWGYNTTTIQDLTPNNKDQTKKATTEPNHSGNGKIGSAQDFDGLNDYSQSANYDLLGTSDNLTISMWIYRDASYEPFGFLVDAGFDVGAAGSKGNYAVITNVATYGQFYITYSYDGTNYEDTKCNTQIAASTWTMLTGVKSGASFDWYINGVKDGTTDTVQSPMMNKSQPITLGAYQQALTSYNYGGLLDEIQISAEAWTAGLVWGSYNSQNSTLLAYNAVESSLTPSITVIYQDNFSRGETYSSIIIEGTNLKYTTADFGVDTTVNSEEATSTRWTGNVTFGSSTAIGEGTVTISSATQEDTAPIYIHDVPYYEVSLSPFDTTVTVIPFVIGGTRYVAKSTFVDAEGDYIPDEIRIYTATSDWEQDTLVTTSTNEYLDVFGSTYPEVSGFEDKMVFFGTNIGGTNHVGYVAIYDFSEDSWVDDHAITETIWIGEMIYRATDNMFYISNALTFTGNTWHNKLMKSSPGNLTDHTQWTIIDLPAWTYGAALGNQALLLLGEIDDSNLYITRMANSYFEWDIYKWNYDATWTKLAFSADATAAPLENLQSLTGHSQWGILMPMAYSDSYPHWDIKFSTDGTSWEQMVEIPVYPSRTKTGTWGHENWCTPFFISDTLATIFVGQNGTAGYWYLLNYQEGTILAAWDGVTGGIMGYIYDTGRYIFSQQDALGRTGTLSIFTYVPPSISNIPSSHDFLVVQPSSTYWANGEETLSQLVDNDTASPLYLNGIIRAGERFNSWPVSVITSIDLLLYKFGAPEGYAYARVRAVSDDSIIGTLGQIDVTTISTDKTYYTFNTTPVTVPTEQDIRILIEYNDGGNSTNFVGALRYTLASVYDGGVRCFYDTSYTEYSAQEFTWRNLLYSGAAPPWPLSDENCIGNVTNNSSFSVDIYFSMDNMTGGTTWVIGATPASNVFTMKICISGAAGIGNCTALSGTPQMLIEELLSDASKYWEFVFYTPTNSPQFDDGVTKTGNITLEAEAH